MKSAWLTWANKQEIGGDGKGGGSRICHIFQTIFPPRSLEIYCLSRKKVKISARQQQVTPIVMIEMIAFEFCTTLFPPHVPVGKFEG